MRTTIEISDLLLEQARRIAAREHTTLRALVEQGLREVITKKGNATGFKLRPASFKGEGLQPQVQAAAWDRIQEMAYEGHGG